MSFALRLGGTIAPIAQLCRLIVLETKRSMFLTLKSPTIDTLTNRQCSLTKTNAYYAYFLFEFHVKIQHEFKMTSDFERLIASIDYFKTLLQTVY